MENNTELRDQQAAKVFIFDDQPVFKQGWDAAYENMEKDFADSVKSFSKVIEQMKKENAKLNKKVKDLEDTEQELRDMYIKPLNDYAAERPKNSVFKTGNSVVAETINRAKAFDMIKELLK